MVWATRSVGSRLILPIDEWPSRTKPSCPFTVSPTSILRTSSSEKLLSNSRNSGPTAQEALLSLALDNSSAERPSKSRRLTSLPSIAPTIPPRLDTTSTTSGSGLFQVDLGCRPASMPVPTEDIVGALVNTSASGPIPTSRYWLQAFWSIKTCFSFIASGEPGLSFERSSPTSRSTSLRMASADAGLPRARSFQDLQVERRKQPGSCRVAAIGRRVGDDALEIADPIPRDAAQRLGRAFFLA